jgi:hypothetical protein
MRMHGLAFLIFATIAAPLHASELAPEAPAEELDVDSTGAKFAIAAMIGVTTGAAAVLADTVSGYGTLATIYAAQLVIPAVIVGGMYYLWISSRDDDGDGDAVIERPARHAMWPASSPQPPDGPRALLR